MNSKVVIAAVIIAIIAIAAASIMMLNSGEKNAGVDATGRALIYGNVNNDDYLDSKDMDLLKSIVSKESWDFKKYPYADVNNDKKVDSDDVKALEKILKKESTIVYYIGSSGSVCSIHYPVTGSLACSSDYGLMMCQVLGVYDRVTHASQDRVIDKLDETRYPGCKSFKSLGNYTSDNYPGFVENFLKSDCQLLLGQVTGTVYDLIKESGAKKDLVLLSPSAEIQQHGLDVVQSIMTCGLLLDHGDEARKYANYCTELSQYIYDNAKNNQMITFVDAYNTNNAVTTTVHTTKGDNGSMTGVIWNLSFLPMTSDVEWNKLDTNGRSLNVEIETIMELDPDIIIVSGWGKVATDDPVSKGQEAFDTMAKYFEKTRAYKNGKIYGISYEMYGTYLGVGGLALLASYIWPGSFEESEGWQMLQDAIDNFTMMDVNVKTMGGIIPYKCNCP